MMQEAFGKPGLASTWSTGAKSGVGTAMDDRSLVWFTLAQGMLNEVYYPRIDTANIKESQLLVAADDFFSEERKGTSHMIERLDAWAPAFRIVNTCLQNRYRITKRFAADPERQVLLQHIRFEALAGEIGDYAVFALVTPHMANKGSGNDAWTGEHKGRPVLFAARDGVYMAVMAAAPFFKSSVGYAGQSDGWTDISRHGAMTWEHSSAPDGNVLLTGQLSLGGEGTATIAFGFGASAEEAASEAAESLDRGFDVCLKDYVRGWRKRTAALRDLSASSGDGGELFRSSVQVFLSHEDKRRRGAMVASLAVPWGSARPADGSVGGYHLVWPRDLVETATARLALDDYDGARETLIYLAGIQQEEGGWHQNNWIDGDPYWTGIQLDETGFPIILAWRLHDAGALGEFDPWPMVKRAAAYLVRTGPVTQQERWEENGGYSPSTLATIITALLCAADLAVIREERELAEYLNSVADWWASNMDAWTFTTNSQLDPDIPAHYERLGTIVMTRPDVSDPNLGKLPVRNLAPDEPSEFPARDVVDAGFLQLVHFGLRSADDRHIVDSVQVVDNVLKVELPEGPSWRRYNHDGYGEHPNGDAFQGWGVGQAWPLLTGERGNYELAAGRKLQAQRLARTMERFAGDAKLLPEQLWAMPDIPAKGLYRGKPSESAMPLVWAHAEYVRLLRSLADERPFGRVSIAETRYAEGPPKLRNVWRFNHKVSTTNIGEALRIETLAPAVLHWSYDNWATVRDSDTIPSGVGTHYIDIPESVLATSAVLMFTFYWPEAHKWEGRDFVVQVLGDRNG
ncbi:glucan 1,4-alpha-glucosidase [Paenibacillus rhizovicinus]|uniref:Glucan 1,4-alpha-glucosidase n=1 Tax=Paenibacillus rhizovicinus TaxID=2704463 RepID=A0A6C0NYF5_9BACL|nr:glycoside hydrolase family 15 protein [Paenibacillus rhizovicinus]QHW29502.1 glucan 1,4-alpha-glucosidase [Paenibacillus rhizovicinus]